ncbi:hypothetical protein KC644_00510 [Candidatus Berkelbacteria bacterium]|nr:hypothetical protein [Candidatus Berkelbacteria bacterium]
MAENLKGIGAAPGEAEGEVMVIMNGEGMDSFPEGNVLVADKVDPTMASLFKRAAAVVTDSGGKTSHAAIFAREHGIPAVVGVNSATSDLQNGTKVKVNGDTGDIVVL